jgi:hypothetical protein
LPDAPAKCPVPDLLRLTPSRYPLKMVTEVVFAEDPAFVLKRAGKFLASQPVLHNLLLSLLHARIAHPEPGRYWLVEKGQEVAGVVVQSPLTFAATFTPMDARATESVVGAIAEAGICLPGVNGDAATASVATRTREWRIAYRTPFSEVCDDHGPLPQRFVR